MAGRYLQDLPSSGALTSLSSKTAAPPSEMPKYVPSRTASRAKRIVAFDSSNVLIRTLNQLKLKQDVAAAAAAAAASSASSSKQYGYKRKRSSTAESKTNRGVRGSRVSHKLRKLQKDQQISSSSLDSRFPSRLSEVKLSTTTSSSSSSSSSEAMLDMALQNRATPIQVDCADVGHIAINRLHEKTVSELKSFLKEHCKSVSGTKRELIERVKRTRQANRRRRSP